MPRTPTLEHRAKLILRWQHELQTSRHAALLISTDRSNAAFQCQLVAACGEEVGIGERAGSRWAAAAQEFVAACRADHRSPTEAPLGLVKWINTYLIYPSRSVLISKATQARMLARERDADRRAKRRGKGDKTDLISLPPSDWETLELIGRSLRIEGHSKIIARLISDWLAAGSKNGGRARGNGSPSRESNHPDLLEDLPASLPLGGPTLRGKRPKPRRLR
jgi:hypothetical protein